MAHTTVCQDGDATKVIIAGGTATRVVLASTTVAKILAGGPPGPPGPQGDPGADASGAIAPVAFAFGDAPTVLYTPAVASAVVRVRVRVTAAFNGLGATLTLGTAADPDAFVTSADLDLGGVMEYELTPDAAVAAGEGIVLTITAGTGATAGTGVVLLTIRPT
ncbi:MAG: hypothetical protein L0H83_11440 [Salinisphaera sp.]|nr:hypothetical protein [Salinisphaera sp.]